MRFPILISYAYARIESREKELVEYLNSPHIDVLLDCGAFTAFNVGKEIRLEDYCKFLDKWGHRIFRYLALDKIGNPVETEANLREMLKNGYKPVPVHIRTDDERRMDELFELSDYVACGGLRRPHIGACPDPYLKAKMKWAKGRPVHWLGYIREQMFNLRPYSCDSATWAASRMYGRTDCYIGRGNWVCADGYPDHEKFVRSPEAMKIFNSFGWTEKDIRNELLWRRNKKKGITPIHVLSEVISADSWVRYVIDVYNRWGIRLFLATVLADDLLTLKGAIDRHAHKLRLDIAPVRRLSPMDGRTGGGSLLKEQAPAPIQS